MTSKEIRNKIYLWIQAKGVNLDKKDHEEIKDILQEFEKCVNPLKQIQQKPIEKKEVKVSWKPFPEH